MKIAAELIAYIFFDIGMAVLLWKLVSEKGKNISFARLISATFCAGFVIGTISASIRGIAVLIVFSALGFILSLISVIFAFIRKKTEVDCK